MDAAGATASSSPTPNNAADEEAYPMTSPPHLLALRNPHNHHCHHSSSLHLLNPQPQPPQLRAQPGLGQQQRWRSHGANGWGVEIFVLTSWQNGSGRNWRFGIGPGAAERQEGSGGGSITCPEIKWQRALVYCSFMFERRLNMIKVQH
ncbi:hypothetical protein PIB30_039236 [Stylosanthes scabra]|uniref:Uncharacterized protein n=1 Tax=Stylosanthes scabra TaxID=79078 RepID=A0ABU6TEH1_9FABA|nr:hypothetical protein [Stylosanthes scabra]